VTAELAHARRTGPMVRIGVPLTGGRLVAAARERGLPVMFSANAFARTYPKGHEREGYFRDFRTPDVAQLAGLDAALDSAGFVAASRYGDYRWSLEDYFSLVEAFPWTWYSALDYACEPELAANRPLRLLRMAATASMLGRCQREASERGLPPPMPILQGWTPDEYAQCASWLPLTAWPRLVGIGSVCRRPVSGKHGIAAILAAVDDFLPRHVKVHLFGAKSGALAALGGHRRLASVDSMAWDAGARAERRTDRDMAFRIQHMDSWAARQTLIAVHARPGSTVRTKVFEPADRLEGDDLVLEALALQYADLIIGGELEYRDAVHMCEYDGVVAIAKLRLYGWSTSTLDDFNAMCDGFGDRVEQLRGGS
jgi:hypothetical protein